MASNMKPVRVRFAPSPTGRTHLGSGRTALYNYLLAHQTGGQFILRIEDTDTKRYVPGAENELMGSLRWLGLSWDEGPDVGGPHAPYKQTERKDIYQHYARQLVENGHAFYCFCSPERLEKVRQEQMKNKQATHYDGTCRDIPLAEAQARVDAGEKYVIRFKMPRQGTVTVHDMLRGDITFENANLDDYIIVKSDGLALYHLAAMVDDHLMGTTHVIRGSEWLSTFPLHAHIIRAFGWAEPAWVHLSLFLNPSGKGKMSKRDSGKFSQDGSSFFIKDLEDSGYLPEAVVNWVALMGWSYDDHTEFFTMQDLVEKFSLEHLNPSPAKIDYSKLDHFNGLHIRALAPEDLSTRLWPFFKRAGYNVSQEDIIKVIPVIRERLVTLTDAPEIASFFFEPQVKPELSELAGKNMTVEQSKEVLQRSLEILEALPEITPAAAELPMRALVDELGMKAGQVFGVLRVAVTGRTVSPPLLESMEILGKEKTLERIKKAIEILSKSELS